MGSCGPCQGGEAGGTTWNPVTSGPGPGQCPRSGRFRSLGIALKRGLGLPAFLVVAVAVAMGGQVHAGNRVRTTGGEVLEGRVTWEPGVVVVTPAAGEAVRVPFDRLLDLTLDEPLREAEVAGANGGEAAGAGTGSATTTTTSTNATTQATNTVQAAAPGPGWAGVQVGAGEPGTNWEDGGAWVVEGGGLGLVGNADSFFFAQRRMDSSGQLVARLESFRAIAPESMAGILIRDNLGESAAYAFVGFRGGSGLCFQYRQIASGMTMRTTNLALGMPVWLRLVRSGGAVVADVSADGRQWQNLARGNVNLGQAVRAGMAVSAGAPAGTVTARFGDPVVGARGVGYAPGSGYPRLVMRGGSVLIAPVDSADDSVVRLGGGMRGSLLSVLNLARIEYVPLTPEMQERVEPDRPGVLLVDGDFLDGGLRSIVTNTVTVSSLLHGFRSFAAGSEVAWLQVGAVEPEDAAFRVVLRNGSELRARRVELGTNTLRAESPLLGALTLARDDIRAVRRLLQEP